MLTPFVCHILRNIINSVELLVLVNMYGCILAVCVCVCVCVCVLSMAAGGEGSSC